MQTKDQGEHIFILETDTQNLLNYPIPPRTVKMLLEFKNIQCLLHT